jgi:uncharacterized caspase-like protein
MCLSRIIRLALVILVAVPVGVTTTRAAEPDVGAAGTATYLAAEPRLWAIVVGVTKYLDPAVPAWEMGVPDARLVHDALVNRAGCAAERVLMMTDDQPKPLQPLGVNLRRGIPEWLAKASPADTVLVFYAGRAFVRAGGRGYLAPQDCEPARAEASAIPIESLREMLAQYVRVID